VAVYLKLKCALDLDLGDVEVLRDLIVEHACAELLEDDLGTDAGTSDYW
jgi:hypothetical protein